MKTPRTMSGLRDLLFTELDNIKKGTTTTTQTRDISKITSQILTSIKLDLDARRFTIESEINLVEYKNEVQ